MTEGGTHQRVGSIDFHGVGMEVLASDPSLWEALRPRLAAQRSRPSEVRAELVFELAGARPRRPAGPLRPVYDAVLGGGAWYAPEPDLLYVGAERRGCAVARCAEGAARIWVRHTDPPSLWLASHPLFTLPLVELLKRRGLFSLHAATVARSGRAAVIAGSSGAGKSTLAVAAHLLGLDLLGDDLAFLRDGDPLELLAFPDEVDLTPESIRLLPGAEALARPARAGWPKRQLDVAARPASARAAAVVFPRIQPGPSRLVRLRASDVLHRLAPNVLLTEPVSAQRHLDALAGLAGRTPCYELTVDSDPGAAADLVAGLLP